MDALVVLTALVFSSQLVCSQAKTTREAVLDVILWQETVEEVNRTCSLGEVLAEYLADIETVEAAASHCADSHRETHSGAVLILQTELIRCVESESRRQRETLVKCVEDSTRHTVSDIRSRITRLKSCVDTS